MSPSPPEFLVGFGYDAHRLVPGRSLILGGVPIPHPLGLDGHSDADVLAHAVTDALIGALGLGDIGRHFPDTDARYRGADSMALLEEAFCWARERGYALNNLDVTLVAQAPRVAPHVAGMRERLAAVLDADPTAVNVKGKTTEGMGFCGRGEGMEAFAVVSLRRRAPG